MFKRSLAALALVAIVTLLCGWGMIAVEKSLNKKPFKFRGEVEPIGDTPENMPKEAESS